MVKARSIQLSPNDAAVNLKVQIVGLALALINRCIVIVKSHLAAVGLAFFDDAMKCWLLPLYPPNVCGGAV